MPWLEAFHRPATIAEALRLAERGGRKARFVGGATDLSLRLDPSITILVDTSSLKLAYIKRRGAGWAIGAGTSLGELSRSPDVRRVANGILAQAALATGSVQLRNMATLAGKLVPYSPASDLALALLVLDARLTIASHKGRRTVTAHDFFVGHFRRTVWNERLLLTEACIPPPPRAHAAAWSFQRLAQFDSGTLIVNVAAGLAIDKQGHCRWARIAVGGLSVDVTRLPQVEAILEGERLNQHSIRGAAENLCKHLLPRTDLRATSGYRAEMAQVLLRRALVECAARMGRKL